MIWLGARLAMDSVFSVGMLIAYLAYKDQFAARVSGLIDKWIEFRMLRLHGERLADIVLTRARGRRCARRSSSAPPADTAHRGRGLGFRYAEGEPWVLKDCSFTVEAGESVAIVGRVGLRQDHAGEAAAGPAARQRRQHPDRRAGLSEAGPAQLPAR